MISDSQMRYGSRVFCQGRSCRPCWRCHATTRAANEADGGSRARGSAAAAARGRLTTVEFSRATLRSMSAASAARAAAWPCRPIPIADTCAISSSSVRRDAAALAQFRLRRADVEQRIGHLLAVRVGGDQLPLRGDGRAVVAARVLRVADPVLRRRRQRAARIASSRSRRKPTIAPAYSPRLNWSSARRRRAARMRPAASRAPRGRRWPAHAPGRGRQATSHGRRRVRRHPGSSGWRDRRVDGRRRRGRRGRRFEPAHTRIEVDVQVALALLRFVQLVASAPRSGRGSARDRP